MTWEDYFAAAITGVAGDENVTCPSAVVGFAAAVADYAVDYAEERRDMVKTARDYAIGEALRVCKENAHA